MKIFLAKLTSLWKKNQFLIFCLLLALILRLPSLFEPYWYGDEGVYLTLGQAVRRGLVLYRDIHDNKPPFLYWLAALADSLFWMKFLLGIAGLSAIVLFSKLAEIIFGQKQRIIKWAVLIFTLLITLPLAEGNIANAENFLIFFTIAGFYLLLHKEKITPDLAFLIGICFSFALLFKVPAGADFGAAVIFLLFFQNKNSPRLLFPLLAGFCLPVLTTILYYFSRNGLSDYLNAAFWQNLGYLSSWQTGTHTNRTLPLALLFRAGVLLILIFFLWLKKRRFSLYFNLTLLWFFFSLFAATLSGRPYSHYLLEVVPSFCLLLGFVLDKPAVQQKRWLLFSFGLLALVIASFRFWFYPTFSYYGNFLDLAIGKKSRNDYFSWFNPAVNRNYEVSNFIVNHTNKDDKIFVWGDEPFIYCLSRRQPAGKYVVAYHIIDYHGQAITNQALIENKPKLIIKITSKKEAFPELESLLEKNYQLLTTIKDAKIYLFLNKPL